MDNRDIVRTIVSLLDRTDLFHLIQSSVCFVFLSDDEAFWKTRGTNNYGYDFDKFLRQTKLAGNRGFRCFAALSQLKRDYFTKQNTMELYQKPFVSLSFEKIYNFPRDLIYLTHLQQLDLSYNYISIIPPSISCLTALQRLNLSYNQIVSIPVELTQLPHLLSLGFSYNRIKKLPPELAAMRQLQFLYVDHNQLTELDPDICLIKNLVILDVSNNCITSLDAISPNVLARVVAYENHIKSIPMALTDRVSI